MSCQCTFESSQGERASDAILGCFIWVWYASVPCVSPADISGGQLYQQEKDARMAVRAKCHFPFGPVLLSTSKAKRPYGSTSHVRPGTKAHHGDSFIFVCISRLMFWVQTNVQSGSVGRKEGIIAMMVDFFRSKRVDTEQKHPRFPIAPQIVHAGCFFGLVKGGMLSCGYRVEP